MDVDERQVWIGTTCGREGGRERHGIRRVGRGWVLKGRYRGKGKERTWNAGGKIRREMKGNTRQRVEKRRERKLLWKGGREGKAGGMEERRVKKRGGGGREGGR